MAPILTTGAGAYVVASGGGGAAYTYVDSFNSNVQNPSKNVTIGTAACRVIVAVDGQNVNTLSSVVVDGVTLTQRAIVTSGDVAGIYDGLLSSGGSSRTVTTNWTTASSLDRDFFVWTIPTTVSYAGVSGAFWSNFPAGFAVSAGDFLFTIARGSGPFDWASSTEVPSPIRTSGTAGWAADWTIASSNASFLNRPGTGGGGNQGMAYAVYR